MNIYAHEFKGKLHSVFTWSVSIAGLIFIYMTFFASFVEDTELLNDALARMPEELLIAFGMTGVDLSTVMGFYSFVFLFCQICLAIQASNYGFGLVSVEEMEMTADFLLVKPISRRRILTSKMLAAVTGLTITNAVIWAASYAAVEMNRAGRPYDPNTLLLLLLSIGVFQLFFFSVGVVLSLVMKRVRSVISLSMALAFGMYVLSAFGGLLGEDTLELITPFKHFEANDIVVNAAYNLPLVVLNAAVIVISIAGSYLLYQRRNIHAAV